MIDEPCVNSSPLSAHKTLNQWTPHDRDHPPGVGKMADKTHRLIYRFNLFFTPLTLTAQVRPGAYRTHPGCSWMAPSGDNNPTTNPADRSVGYARLNAHSLSYLIAFYLHPRSFFPSCCCCCCTAVGLSSAGEGEISKKCTTNIPIITPI